MSSLFRRAVTGMLAGAAGTLAMDAFQYRRQQDGGGESFRDWEVSSPSSFEEASAPGKLAQRATDVVDVELPDRSAALTTNATHWLTGVGYGLMHALFHHDRGAVRGGLVTGVSAFATSYTTLGATGIYQPIWEYDRETLQEDLAGHLVYGLVTGVAYGVLARGADGDTDG